MGPVGDPVVGSRGLYSLLALESERVILEAPEDFPPEQRHMRAGPDRAGGGGPLACIVMRPPTELVYSLADPPPGARLEFAVAIRVSGYRGRGAVRWMIHLDGELLYEVRLDCSESVPSELRRWLHADVPLVKGGELRFRVDYEGEAERGPPVGLGLLRVVLPYETPRQRWGPGAPNVILVVVDTLRASALGCLGNERDTSPVMDRLAREGTLFERAYSSAPWTIPGTASVLTGLSIPQHGLGDSGSNSLSDRLDTLATVFARAGFTTAAFSCNPLIDVSRNFHRGFEHFTTRSWVPVPGIQEEVLSFLSQVGRERFFLYLHPTDPHVPYRPTAASLSRLGIGEAADVYTDKVRAVVNRWYGGGEVELERLLRTNAHNLELYGAETAVVDAFLGELLAVLEKEGLAQDTVICITADHGEEFLEHGLVGHFNQLFSESVHVPLILWGPGVARGVRVAAPTENRHVAPTLLRAAGVGLPPAMAGPSLLSPEDREAIESDGVFLTSQKGRWVDLETRQSLTLGTMNSWIDGSWQLIDCPETQPPGQGFTRLYDLSEDPDCRNDLSAVHPERVLRMQARIEAWLADGRAARPELVPTSEETLQLMKDIGYIGGDDEEPDEGGD